jgi:hypothetical protein
MPRISRPSLASTLIAAAALCPVGRVAVAADVAPTTFQRAISSWMGVVALLADEGDADRKEAGESRRDRDRGERGGREGRGPRERSRPGDHGPRGDGRIPHMGRPPMGPGMHGMPMPGMRPDAQTRLDEIVARLSRIEQKLDAAPRAGNPWSPRPEWGSGPSRGPRPERSEEARREMEKRREEWRKAMEARRSQSGQSADERPRAPQAAMPPEMQDRVREMMEAGRKRMAEAHEKMEQARKKFQEMEERIKKLEAEVERLKSSK